MNRIWTSENLVVDLGLIPFVLILYTSKKKMVKLNILDVN